MLHASPPGPKKGGKNLKPLPGIGTNGQDESMRTFGVEEELLLVDAVTFSPLPAGDRAVQLHAEAQEAMGQRADPGEPGDPSGHEVTTEFQQEQFEVAYPPQTTLAAQLETIRAGRALADTAASRVGVAWLPCPPRRGRSPHIWCPIPVISGSVSVSASP